MTWCSLPFDPGGAANPAQSLGFAVAENGAGPTALLIAGIHGDEIDGQVVLSDLLRSIEISSLAGRLIVVPRGNPSAARNGLRAAPDDAVDLNRCMPGQADGTVTERLAHIIATMLLPEADLVVDLHSGGRDYISAEVAWIAPGGDFAARRELFAAARAFGAPFTLVAEGPGTGTLAAAARDKIYIGTDTPGAGLGAPAAIRRMHEGVVRLLQHTGLLKGSATPTPPSRFVRVAQDWGEVLAPCAGLFEPVAEIGEELARNQVVARLHPEDFSAAPSEVLCPSAATLLGRLPAGPVGNGKRIAVLGVDAPSIPT